MSTVATDGITREQLAFLRKAQSVSFHHHNGRTYIRADAEWSGEGPRLELTVSGEVGLGYSSDGSRDHRHPFTAAFAMIHSARYHNTWRTTVGAIRAGEHLELSFLPDHGTNGYAKDAGLHVDEVYLVVTPAGGDRAKRRTYHLETSVCADNSARMCRR